jgi:glutamine synthetase adenylyltransferase
VRAPGTQAALEALSAAGRLTRDDFLTLAETYAFLQRLRNLGYLRTGLPADVLPVRAEERLRHIARLMGFADDA